MIISEEFGRWLRDQRTRLGLTQQQLADRMFVSHVAISHWENGKRLPDISTLTRLANCLGVSDTDILNIMHEPFDPPTVILVDDEKIILTGSLHVLEEVMPDIQVFAFSTAEKALEFARANQVDVAFLDIELSGENGLALADQLMELNPLLNIIYVTAYPEYMSNAWLQNASGYVMKPLTVERVTKELQNLRHPVRGLLP